MHVIALNFFLIQHSSVLTLVFTNLDRSGAGTCGKTPPPGVACKQL